MYAFVGILLFLVLGQSAVMMKKAYDHAMELGIEKSMINSVVVSIVPTLPVIVVFLSLVPLLGSPLPWLRLSVIGSATFESMQKPWA